MSTDKSQCNSLHNLIASSKKQQKEFESLTNKLQLERAAIIVDLQKCTDGISDTVSIASLTESDYTDYHPVKPPRESLLDLYLDDFNELSNRGPLMETLKYDLNTPNQQYSNIPYHDYNQNKETLRKINENETYDDSSKLKNMTKNSSDDRFSFHDFETGLPVYDGALSSQQALNSQPSNLDNSPARQYTSDIDSSKYYNERDIQHGPPYSHSNYREDPYNDSKQEAYERDEPYPNNVREDPYASHNVQNDPYSNNVAEDPYASHSVRDDPYSNNVAEDPYASHSVRDDPYSNNVAEDPYASHSVRDDPYSNNVAEDPYASHSVRDDPYSNNVAEDPYTSHSVRDDPYSNNVAEDPYASHSVRDDPYSNNVAEDPYASHSVRDDPYSNNVAEDPYASHSVRDDPYSNNVAEDPYGTHSVRNGTFPYNNNNTEDYEPVTAYARSNDGKNDLVNPYATGNYDGTNYGSEDQHNSFDINNRFEDDRYRKPELFEVIELLHHPDAVVKLNAASYLQHRSFMNDIVKQQTGSLGGIPALVELINHDKPEVQRAACGALRNLSYGRSNDDNKRAIKNSSGISSLIRLLRKSTNDDIHEMVTAILWNLSSCKDLKRSIIDDALTVLVNSVIINYSTNMMTIVFRNATGVLRNVSSEGEYGRRKLRECESLVRLLLDILKRATLNSTSPATGSISSIDSKSIENCTCALRNISYAAQEATDPSYHERKKTDGYNTMPMSHHRNQTKEKKGCFGRNKKEPHTNKPMMAYQSDLLRNNAARLHIEALWQTEVVNVYLPLLEYCTNPETTEAACACIQNLTACDWQPAVNIRIAVRKEKGLQVITNLLSLQADKVIHSAAVALRNLAVDESNKQLISQYASEKLCSKLPSQHVQQMEFQISDSSICAVEAAIFQLVQNNVNCASILLREGAVQKLIDIKCSPSKYSSKILDSMWKFKELHNEYKKMNLKENDFISKSVTTIKKDNSYSTQTTLQREPLGYDSTPVVSNNKEREIYYSSSATNQAYTMNEFNSSKNQEYYGNSSTLEGNHENNGMINSQAQNSLTKNRDEVYAKVNRHPEPVIMDLTGETGNAADSWV